MGSKNNSSTKTYCSYKTISVTPTETVMKATAGILDQDFTKKLKHVMTISTDAIPVCEEGQVEPYENDASLQGKKPKKWGEEHPN